jgi:hypothetical protein
LLILNRCFMQAVPENTLWLGKDCVTPYPWREVFLRLLRTLVQATFFRRAVLDRSQPA